MPNGFLLVDKPGGVTSHDVVALARRALGTRKIGHAGTLDPMATGLLVLGVGPSTRLLTFAVGLPKTYLATIRLGVSTSTDDADGVEVASASARGLSAESVEAALATQRGWLRQVPSAVSAIRVGGRRAYDRVRDGESVELPARDVEVSRLEVLELRGVGSAVVDVDVAVDCSSGTYIRAIARDVGAALSVGGHLTSLRRTRVGDFTIDEAHSAGSREVPGISTDDVLPAADAATRLMPVVVLDDAAARDVAHGRPIPLAGRGEVDRPEDVSRAAAVDAAGRLLAVLSVRGGRGQVEVGFPALEVGS